MKHCRLVSLILKQKSKTKQKKKTTKMINKNTMKRECSNGKLSTSVKKGGQFSTNHGINIGSLA